MKITATIRCFIEIMLCLWVWTMFKKRQKVFHVLGKTNVARVDLGLLSISLKIYFWPMIPVACRAGVQTSWAWGCWCPWESQDWVQGPSDLSCGRRRGFLSQWRDVRENAGRWRKEERADEELKKQTRRGSPALFTAGVHHGQREQGDHGCQTAEGQQGWVSTSLGTKPGCQRTGLCHHQCFSFHRRAFPDSQILPLRVQDFTAVLPESVSPTLSPPHLFPKSPNTFSL